MTLYHGGIRGLNVGDVLVPSDPHVVDDCPICEGRKAGRTTTVGEYRAWLLTKGPRAVPVLLKLRGVPDDAPIDPPSERRAIYVTSDLEYARSYAGRSQGDLYRVESLGGPLEQSDTDHFPTWTVQRARIVEVLARNVRRSRRERRALERRWKKADEAHTP